MRNLHIPADLISFLQQIKFSDKCNDADNDCIPVTDHTNQYKSEYFISYPTILGVDQKVAFEKIQSLLEAAFHEVSNEIIAGILTLFCLSPQESRSIAFIEEFFALMKSVSMKQYIFFNGLSLESIKTLKFFNYTIGTLDYAKYEDFVSRHSGSDYLDCYPRESNKRTGIEVKAKPVVVIDIYQWLTNCGLDIHKIPNEIQNQVNIYFDAISSNRYQVFLQEFNKQQAFITAYFGVIYDLNDIEKIGLSFINIFYGFLGRSSAGWLHPANRSMTGIAFPDSRLIEPVNKFLTKNSEFLSNQNGPFGRHLSIVTDFFARGEQHLSQRLLNQAFIEFFVGLDFLLAPDTEKSKKLKARIGILSHTAMNRNLPEHLEKLDTLYDMRSDYIHNGKDVTQEQLWELRDITKVVIAVLFNLHKKHSTNGQFSYENWIELIDHIHNKIFTKGIQPNVLEQKKLGTYTLEGLILTEDLARIFGLL